MFAKKTIAVALLAVALFVTIAGVAYAGSPSYAGAAPVQIGEHPLSPANPNVTIEVIAGVAVYRDYTQHPCVGYFVAGSRATTLAIRQHLAGESTILSWTPVYLRWGVYVTFTYGK
jgi:hypothetical protein